MMNIHPTAKMPISKANYDLVKQLNLSPAVSIWHLEFQVSVSDWQMIW